MITYSFRGRDSAVWGLISHVCLNQMASAAAAEMMLRERALDLPQMLIFMSITFGRYNPAHPRLILMAQQFPITFSTDAHCVT